MAIEVLDVNTLFGAHPSQHADTTAESLVATLQGQGVQSCLALSTLGLYHNDSAGNRETLNACREFAHLIPVATLDPRSTWTETPIRDEFSAGSFKMVRFFPAEQNWPVDFAPFVSVVNALSKSGRTPLMVSVKESGDVTKVGRILCDYPHPVILAGVNGAILAEAIVVLSERPHFYLETHALHTPDALSALRDHVGINRILFGSNAPGRSLNAALRYVKRSNLSDLDKISVLGTNAQEIWQSGENS